MTSAENELRLHTPAIYRIQVQGSLDADRSDWFEGMRVVSQAGLDDIVITSLCGKIVDQAALHGVLRKLYDLGMPLLSVSYIGPEPVA